MFEVMICAANDNQDSRCSSAIKEDIIGVEQRYDVILRHTQSEAIILRDCVILSTNVCFAKLIKKSGNKNESIII